jgi:WD40 repeat protein
MDGSNLVIPYILWQPDAVPDHTVLSLAISHDCELVATGSQLGTICLWAVHHLNSSPSSSSSSSSSSLDLLTQDDVAPGFPRPSGLCARYLLVGHSAAVSALTFLNTTHSHSHTLSHSSCELLSASADGSVRLWDARDGRWPLFLSLSSLSLSVSLSLSLASRHYFLSYYFLHTYFQGVSSQPHDS